MTPEEIREGLIGICDKCDEVFDSEPLGNLRSVWLIDKFIRFLSTKVVPDRRDEHYYVETGKGYNECREEILRRLGEVK